MALRSGKKASGSCVPKARSSLSEARRQGGGDDSAAMRKRLQRSIAGPGCAPDQRSRSMRSASQSTTSGAAWIWRSANSRPVRRAAARQGGGTVCAARPSTRAARSGGRCPRSRAATGAVISNSPAARRQGSTDGTALFGLGLPPISCPSSTTTAPPSGASSSTLAGFSVPALHDMGASVRPPRNPARCDGPTPAPDQQAPPASARARPASPARRGWRRFQKIVPRRAGGIVRSGSVVSRQGSGGPLPSRIPGPPRPQAGAATGGPAASGRSPACWRRMLLSSKVGSWSSRAVRPAPPHATVAPDAARSRTVPRGDQSTRVGGAGGRQHLAPGVKRAFHYAPDPVAHQHPARPGPAPRPARPTKPNTAPKTDRASISQIGCSPIEPPTIFGCRWLPSTAWPMARSGRPRRSRPADPRS